MLHILRYFEDFGGYIMLTSRLFAGNTRLARAAENAPPLRRGENDHDAVRLLQQALQDLNVASLRRSQTADGMLDGDYGSETFEAVRKFQEDNGLNTDGRPGDGIAGRETLGMLDDLAAARNLSPRTAAAAAVAPPPTETPETLPVTAPRIPSAAVMMREYRRFVEFGGAPCRSPGASGDGITNQCAIRLSIALGRAGIGFHMNAAPGVRLIVHRANHRACGGHIEVPHDARAQRLFDHLSSFWRFTTYRITREQTGASVYTRVQNTPGLVFFDNIGASSATAGGDHIDFFDGNRIMNDELNYAAPGEPRGRDPNTTFVATRTAIHFLPINP